MSDRIFKIYISAGHGMYFNEEYKHWLTQRRSYFGVIEDFWTVFVARELFVLLDEDSRFQVVMNRDFFNEEIGESGKQKWMEGSHLFFRDVGAPQTVWNVGQGIQKAIHADAMGIKFYDADIAISIHANSGGGEDAGYEVWHHSMANLGRKLAGQINKSLMRLPIQSRGLFCDALHDERAFWREARGVVMAVIEYFYFDHEIDNQIMKMQKNISQAAQLTYQGISEFIDVYGHSIPQRIT
ncbi:MAG: N-acetylmuramoyl-L-alanine amidase [Candidatus Zhuqueibacterota bacterium]